MIPCGSPNMRTELILAALQIAVTQRQPRALIHHSDRGSQYTSYALGKRWQEASIMPSMGSGRDAYDNAMAESFFATLERKVLDSRRFKSQAEARMAIFEWIEGWYNPHRRHSGLGYRSPVNYERAHHQARARMAELLPPWTADSMSGKQQGSMKTRSPDQDTNLSTETGQLEVFPHHPYRTLAKLEDCSAIVLDSILFPVEVSGNPGRVQRIQRVFT
jgi:hypothetical protein